MIRYVDPALRGAGVIKADRILGRMADIIGEVLIEDLEIPYTAVAVDLFAHREVWFQRGAAAGRDPCLDRDPDGDHPGGDQGSGPGRRWGGQSGADRTDAVARLRPDRGGVAVGGGAGERHPGPLVRQSAQPQRPDWWTRLRHSIDVSKLRERVNPTPGPDRPAEEEGVFDDLPINLKYADVIQHSMDSQSAMIERFRLAASPPDVLVTIPVDSAAVFDFHRADELIKLGREAAEEALERAGFGLGSAG